MTILSKPKFLRSPWLHWSNSSLLSRNLDWDWIWKSALSSLLRENICHIINNEGFQANPEYVHTIDEMKHPTMEKELQCFIRHLVWIQQFFDNPSTQTNLNRQVLHPDGPLYTNLTGSVNYLSGLKEWIRPLKNIKKCFSSPMISFSNFTGLFTLTTDISDITCKAMQETKNGWKMIIAVISYFQPMGHNWSINDWSICYKMGHI